MISELYWSSLPRGPAQPGHQHGGVQLPGPRGLPGHRLPQRPRQHRAHQQLHQPLQERGDERGVLYLLLHWGRRLQLELRDGGQDDVLQTEPGRPGLSLLRKLLRHPVH